MMREQVVSHAGGAGTNAVTDAARARWRFSIAYYVVLAVWHVVVHQQLFEDLVGVPTSRWFWRANEVYVVAVFVPLFWDLVATRRRRNGVELVSNSTAGPGPLARHVIWYGFLFVVTICLFGPLWKTVFGSRLPQRIATLRDVGLGFLILSVYFDWSRGLWRPLRDQAPRLVSGWWRMAFMLVVLGVNVAIFQEPVKNLLGTDASSTLDFQAEAFALAFFVSLYFDVVLSLTGGDPLRATPGPLRSRRRWAILAMWIAIMLFFVWIGQGAARSWFDNAFGQWFVRSSEPPLAALVFTLYFEVIRRLDGVPDAALVPADARVR